MLSDSDSAAAQFWDGMREVAAAATRHQDEELFGALHKIGRAITSGGLPIPTGGQFVPCPVCRAVTGQSCINTPGHPLNDQFHPERVELGEKLMAELAPIP